MSKMTVEDSSLTAVADAIRARGETTEPLVFPDGFVSAVEGMKVPADMRSIAERSITEITEDMLEGCTEIGMYAFCACDKLKRAVLPETVTKLKVAAFSQCTSLESINIPSGVTEINSNVLFYCPKLVQDIVIPDTCTFLGASVFGGSGITSAIVSKNISVIRNNVFGECKNLTTLEFRSIAPPSITTTSLNGNPKLTKIIVPKGSLDAYKTATNWSEYADLMVEAEE